MDAALPDFLKNSSPWIEVEKIMRNECNVIITLLSEPTGLRVSNLKKVTFLVT